MKLYNEYLRVKNRQARRAQWLAKSPVYTARLELIKQAARQKLSSFQYEDNREKLMLEIIVTDAVNYPITNIKVK